MTATSQLYHGMSFTQMAQSGTPFTFSDFVPVLAIGMVTAFAAGVIWSLTHSFFLRLRGAQTLRRIENQTLQQAEMKPLLPI